MEVPSDTFKTIVLYTFLYLGLTQYVVSSVYVASWLLFYQCCLHCLSSDTSTMRVKVIKKIHNETIKTKRKVIISVKCQDVNEVKWLYVLQTDILEM